MEDPYASHRTDFRMRFFDYNATTPLLPEAREAWLEAADELWLNPSSPYRAAARVRVRLRYRLQVLEQAQGLVRVAADEARAEEIRMLNRHLAETADLRSQVKQAHWNVKGEDRPVVVHGVQHVFHPPAALPQWPDDGDRRTQLVFIVRDLERKVVADTMRAFLADTSEATR